MNAYLVWPSTLILFVMLFPQAAHAGLRPDMTPQEFKAMEPVCQAIGMGEINGMFWAEALNKPENKHILDEPGNAMAKDAGWFHHYCWGKLGKLRYFSAKTQDQKNFQIRRWRNNMEFIVNWTSQHQIDWPYIHLIYKEIAESYLYEKNYLKAIGEAEIALKKNPEYAGTYVLIADAYTEIKNRSKALEYVTDGLQYNPDSKALQRRYRTLGGKMPYPDPITRNTLDADTPATKPTSSPPASTDTASAPGVQAPQQDQGSSDDVQSKKQPDDNPYCRFCP